jgi:SHAQKYF class myb-like DNA-binding protein
MSPVSEALESGIQPEVTKNESDEKSSTLENRNEPTADALEAEQLSKLETPAIPSPPASGATNSSSKNVSKSKKKKGQSAITTEGVPGQAAASLAPGENTGRWTAEEHRLFLQGLEQHGKGWKKIASLIKSRTVVQIRTHAQKYFQKLAKARQNGEEGDITMEGRGGNASITSNTTATAAMTNKRRRHITGTKRKVIQSIVASAQRQAKKAHLTEIGDPSKYTVVPGIAPALAYFVTPIPSSSSSPDSDLLTDDHISGPVFEDSL